MKKLLYTALALSALTACKTEEKKSAPTAQMTEQEAAPSPLEAMAEAHGYEHWDKVEALHFTFNVDRGDTHYERSWIWEPGADRVTQIAEGDTVSYVRSEVDSTLVDVDAGFINDKYWLLAPYQWVWDQDNFTHTIEEGVAAPLSGAESRKLTIVYADQGGYTPGDAYDFFIGEDARVSEWIFRKGNQEEPSLITTWEAYEQYNGLQLATMHKNADGSFQLYFTGIEVH